MKDMSLIMEGWRGFLNEQTEDRGSPSHTKYTDRIDRLVGVIEKSVLHLKEFLEHLESLYDQANLNKGRGGYTYLGLGKKRPATLKKSEDYKLAAKKVEASITGYIQAIRKLFSHLKRGTTKNLYADEIKRLSKLVRIPKENIFRGMVDGGNYSRVSSTHLAKGDVSFNQRKQMVEKTIALLEGFADDVLLDYIRSHNLFVDWAKDKKMHSTKLTNPDFEDFLDANLVKTFNKELAYSFPVDIAPQLECSDKIAYFEEILKSYEDNPNIIGRTEDLLREKVDFQKMIGDPSPYERCANKMGIEKTAQQSTDAEMADFDLNSDK